MSSNSRNDRVAQALGIYRSIAACNEHLARRGDVHALTAALMLPCYQAEFRRLANDLSPAEQDELRRAHIAADTLCARCQVSWRPVSTAGWPG
jgi:hypothetical protein